MVGEYHVKEIEEYLKYSEELKAKINELKITGITLSKLRELCEDYDEEYGSYPENEFEGLSVLEFIIDKIKGVE